MADVGGTPLFDDVGLDTAWPEGLPRFVPQVDGHDVAALDEDLAWPAYAVGLRRVYSPRSHSILPAYRGAASAHEVVGLRPGQLAVLSGYGEDPLVEGFWTRRHRDGLVRAISAMNWDLILTPNYSVYGNQPRAEHLINCKRNLIIAAEFADAGCAVAPNCYWYRLEDLERTVAWVHDVEAPAVATNLQTFRTREDWEEMALPGLAYLAASLPPGTKVVLSGSSRADRIATLVELFGERLHLVSANSQQYALHGARMTAAGRVDGAARKADLFAANVRYYASLLELPPAAGGGAAG